MRNSRQWQLLVEGTVQGVGFRPFVARTAAQLGLAGEVCNTPHGVTIALEGSDEALAAFRRALESDPPPLARIQRIDCREESPTGLTGFQIRSSRGAGGGTLISPDIAPCAECLAELDDTDDRRHDYPFINCTNCGPRYSIIAGVPYDRPKTTMRAFMLCPACRTEYEDALDRRFHAQPNACAECGPKLEFVASSSREIGVSGNPLDDALSTLAEGRIVAIKGVGGYHLACDANDEAAVAELRRRKQRDEKPLAVMVGDLDAARALCHLSEAEARLLASPQRPIVLAHRRADAPIAAGVAPGNRNLGIMLPSSPLHHLLFSGSRVTGHGSRALVMTSGNISDEPIAYEDDEAFDRLKNIADAFLTHDRGIHVRIDDSIVREMDGAPLILRRARGFVPEPIHLSFELPPLFAAGADMKGALCVAAGRNAILSQHLGDLEHAAAARSLEETTQHLLTLFDVTPEIIACDLHPDYTSTRFAHLFSKRITNHESRITAVQHHHAHIASCMAENDLPNEPVIGIALDGTGLGIDGTIWGGELLVADYAGFTRAAHLAPVPMPGGDKAAREPWRMALAYAGETAADCFDGIPREQRDLVLQMLEKGINCPTTSSCGRLFDAVAALVGLRTVNAFEGQAAMEFEQICDEACDEAYGYAIENAQIHFAPMIEQIITDISSNTPQSIIAARFHNTLIEALTESCQRIRDGSRITNHESRVCFSGGCFQNARLAAGLEKKLEDQGFAVYTHALVPPNDGGIALGQAVVAAHRAAHIC